MMEGNSYKTLLHLNTFIYSCSSVEVVKTFISLNRCTQLESIALHWKLYDGPYTVESLGNTDFKRLKSN